jgi:membrane associated rhomboid family serine protease
MHNKLENKTLHHIEVAENNTASFIDSLKLPLMFTTAIWFIHAFQTFVGVDLGYWGIYARETFGLRGILFAPLLHADWTHLVSNSLPFLITSVMVIYFFPSVAMRAFILIYFLSGFFVWIFARTGVFHIGLSYVVYGLVSFVFWTGVFRRSARSIVLSLLVMTFYSGMIEGVLPTAEILHKNISWDSHLIGAIMGIIIAYFFKSDLEAEEIEDPSVSEGEKRPFFAADAFDRTRDERYQDYLDEQERLRKERDAEEARRFFPPFGGWISDSTY